MEVTPVQNLDPLALVEDAPDDEYALLELRIDWPPDLEIYPQHLQLWLRFFVITKDPLSWIPNRGEAWATVSADEEVLEVDVYVLDAIRRGIEENGGDLAAAVGRYAAPAMQAALEHEELLISEDYLDLAVTGDAPRLLDDADRDLGPFATPPTLQVRQAWGTVGLGAIRNLVQEAFGYVDLDRSNVARSGRTGRRALSRVRGRELRLPGRARERPRADVRGARGAGGGHQPRPSRRCSRVQSRRLARDRQGGDARQQRARAVLRAAAAAHRGRRTGSQRSLSVRKRQEVQAMPRGVRRPQP
jgi:hypothetical protein